MSQKTLEQIQQFEGKYPKQLWYLFAVEMWERFCFYGMRAILALFMVSQLELNDHAANLKYGAIQAFVYAFTFIGGIAADKVLGFRKSLFFGGTIMIAGNILIAASPTAFFYIGISLSIIGTGFFKPNISSMVGQLYAPGDARRDAGFSLFYAGINVGAFLGGIICVYLGKYVSWSAAFAAAGVVMAFGLFTFQLTKHTLGPIGKTPAQPGGRKQRYFREILVYVAAIAAIPFILIMIQNTQYTDYFMYTIGPLALIYFCYQWIQMPEKQFKRSLLVALVFIFAYIFYIAFFEQMGGSLNLFAANNLKHHVLFFRIDPNMVNNSSGALFIILLSSPLGLLWIWMAKRKIEPNTTVKFGLGFLLLAVGFYFFYSTRFFADEHGITSLNVFTLAYFFITLSELCIGPIGMSVITKLSPNKLTGMMMGLWFLGSAYGQYVAGLLGAGMSTANERASLLDKLMAYTKGYQELAFYALAIGFLLLLISPRLKRFL
ncbi:peptide MFS transporter [Olivibacter sp. SDN3]|nr:peptide MFS transporter [Olivibacter sp. SDN3]QNL52395.1 peptide MFS transporter [Olivibacter sp. SDN3]